MLDTPSATIAERHSAVREAALLDEAHTGGSRQFDKSVRHDYAMTAIGKQVLMALDDLVSWEQASGARSLKALMPEFRRAVKFGELDPTRCPHDDGVLEQFEEADENGVYPVFQCPGGSHTFRAAPGTFGEVPDLSEFES